jgi:hypothetical protein
MAERWCDAIPKGVLLGLVYANVVCGCIALCYGKENIEQSIQWMKYELGTPFGGIAEIGFRSGSIGMQIAYGIRDE